MSSPLVAARHMVEEAKHVAVVSHIRPDGDAVGSLLGLTASLQRGAKLATPILVDGVPRRFRFLPGAEHVVRSLPATYDLLIAVDCSDRERLGVQSAAPITPHLNIDHHPTNTNFAELNLVDPAAASTAEMLFQLLPELGLPLDERAATNLLAGIVADTLGFRTPNVSPSTLRDAAALMELGAPLAAVYQRALLDRSLVDLRYWGAGLLRLQQEDGLVWTRLTAADRTSVGYQGRDDADLIQLLTTLEEALVIVLLVEQPDGTIKVSWRARPGYNVAAVAQAFGGGGHEPAAGAMVDGLLDDVEANVLAATRPLLAANHEPSLPR